MLVDVICANMWSPSEKKMKVDPDSNYRLEMGMHNKRLTFRPNKQVGISKHIKDNKHDAI